MLEKITKLKKIMEEKRVTPILIAKETGYALRVIESVLGSEIEPEKAKTVLYDIESFLRTR